jgi:hypothetical protein
MLRELVIGGTETYRYSGVEFLLHELFSRKETISNQP